MKSMFIYTWRVSRRATCRLRLKQGIRSIRKVSQRSGTSHQRDLLRSFGVGRLRRVDSPSAFRLGRELFQHAIELDCGAVRAFRRTAVLGSLVIC
jgi:hypothetical protein